MTRWGLRVTTAKFHWAKCDEVVKRNRRIGTGLTGVLEAPHLFNPSTLDFVYASLVGANALYAKQLGINPSIRKTVIKPSGTMSKFMGAYSEGVHPAYSRYFIQRIRIASNDALIPRLQAAGHYMEPVEKFDGTLDPDTQVVDFYVETPQNCPVSDEGFDTWKQLDTVLMAQKHWADQSVSVTVYYGEKDLPKIKEWVNSHLKDVKTLSFLRHSGHGFKQAPKEPITKEQYDAFSSRVRPLDVEGIDEGAMIDGSECAGGACPVR
jgi:hypothetical protein